MRRVVKHLKLGLKMAAVSSVAGSALGYAYLQYVNSIIGPIDLDYDRATNYYR